jgi:branched-chain amino acid transport system ATP-binding protein
VISSLLVARHINKRYGGIVAVDNVSLEIARLDVKCIIGANGAGKSTLFNIMCGASPADAGALEFEGRDITNLPLHQFARIGIARKFQIPSVFDSLTVADNLLVALPGRVGGHRAAARVEEILSLIALPDRRDHLAGLLAHGHKQWLEIGMALMSSPKLLLLDEPTAGMTPEETQRTALLVKAVASRIAIVAIEHDMAFVRALGCDTYVMHQGAIIAEGAFADIARNNLVRDVYLGRA